MYLNVSSSPHIRDNASTRRIMIDVIIALMPALVASVFIFGVRAISLTAVTVVSCVVFEAISRIVMKREQTIGDGSAVVTGLLLAYCMPATLPYWMAVFGAFVAIVVTKQMFGGLGSNIANPAIVGRIVLGVSFAGEMNTFAALGSIVGKGPATDLITTATPLTTVRHGGHAMAYLDLLLGKHAGTIGEVCAAALVLGFIYLLVRGVVDLWISGVYIVVTLAFVTILGADPLFHLLSGGLLLGAFFMATDYVTSPPTVKGKIWFGVGLGLLTGLLRLFASAAEGVSFAILLMNLLNPHIERWTQNKTIGGVDYAG